MLSVAQLEGACKGYTLCFNDFCHIAPVHADRENFHTYSRAAGVEGIQEASHWWLWWDRFLQEANGKDERGTLQDALR